ncbi:A/G-specific adenine glycosylase [Candidatus Microgenomates bacterium]|nr:A/G-specific adenine glycosylase [Candidatus Microgenomates bacterium]
MNKEKQLSQKVITGLQKTIYKYYKTHKRELPWRKTRNPYHILVSEVMLQQTQVPRVIEKYNQFLHRFPTIDDLAKASLREVLATWLGLGYNRRALSLKKLAEKVTADYNGVVPQSVELLQTLPGIGTTTASSIAAFAWNYPSVFIETNIRSVFIYFFFRKQQNVSDEDILPLVEQTLDRKNPRLWYWALMDYGVILKKIYKNPSRKSLQYKKQKPFKNSDRQIRGAILKIITTQPLSPPSRNPRVINPRMKRSKSASADFRSDRSRTKIPRAKSPRSFNFLELSHHFATTHQRIAKIFKTLEEEGFIIRKGKRYTIS